MLCRNYIFGSIAIYIRRIWKTENPLNIILPGYFDKMFKYLWDNIFSMVGFKDIAVKYFKNVLRSSDEARAGFLEESKEFVNLIFDKKLGKICQIGAGKL
jgi:hypothetical protein